MSVVVASIRQALHIGRAGWRLEGTNTCCSKVRLLAHLGPDRTVCNAKAGGFGEKQHPACLLLMCSVTNHSMEAVMNTATTPRTRFRRRKRQEPKNPATVRPTKDGRDRHVMRDAEKRNAFPKRPNKATRPFETTMDF